MASLTALAALLVAGHGPWAGDVLVGLSTEHGLNTGDVPVLVVWLLGVGCCVFSWRR